MVIKEDVLISKEAEIIKFWCPGYRAGDETAGDITFSGSSSAGSSRILIGRQSGTGNNLTNVHFRDRTSAQGMTMSATGITISSTNPYASVNTWSLIDGQSTTKAGMVFPRMTTAQASTLSGNGVSSGAVVFDCTRSKLMVFSGAIGTTGGGYWVDLN